MKSFIFSLFSLSLLMISCDDGDVPVTTLGFDDIEGIPEFDFCSVEEDNKTVFYLESDSNEVMTFELNSIFDNRIDNEQEISVSNGAVVYKKYTSDINTDNLFCRALPPSNLTFDNELISNRGTAKLVTQLVIKPGEDDDGDGLTNEEEGIDPDKEYLTEDSLEDLPDFDNDGIPDFRDEDDDNDNVYTKDELQRDADGDVILDEGLGSPSYTLEANRIAGIPDHLNIDDDGDGKKTYDEVREGSIEPLRNTDPDGVPFYKIADDPNDPIPTDQLLTHKFDVNTITSLVIDNLGLTNGDTTRVQDEFDFGEKSLKYENDDFNKIGDSDETQDRFRSEFEEDDETTTE